MTKLEVIKAKIRELKLYRNYLIQLKESGYTRSMKMK